MNSKAQAINLNLIADSRKARGWSQAQLSEAAGISLKDMRMLEESGNGSADVQQKVAAALGIRVDNLTDAAAAKKNKIQEAVIWIVVIFILMCFGGYQFGKDLALRDNMRDCIASGKTDC